MHKIIFRKWAFREESRWRFQWCSEGTYPHSTVFRSNCAWLWRFLFKSKMPDKAIWSLLLLCCLIHGRAFSDLLTFLTVGKAEVTISYKSNITAFWWKCVVPCQLREFPSSGSLGIPSARSWAFFRRYELSIAVRLLMKGNKNLSGWNSLMD